MNRAAYVLLGAAVAVSPALAQSTGSEAEAGNIVRLTLREAVETARRESPRLAQLRSLESAADAGYSLARAQRMPALDLSAGYIRYSNIPELTLPLPGLGDRILFPNIPNNYRTRLGVSVPLFTGGRIAGGISSASGEREAAAKDVETGVDDLVLEVTGAYWGLVTTRESERVLGEAIAAYDSHLKAARDREELGMAARNEVLAVQVERDRAELARLQAANAEEVASANLGRLLGLPPGARIEAADPLEAPATPEEDVETLVSAALAARPERAALEARAGAAGARIEAQQAGSRPQLSAAAGYEYSNPNSRILPPEPTWKGSWNVGVSLSFNVFDGGRTSAAVAQATAQADAARRAIEDLDRRIRLDVTSRFLDLRTAREAVRVAGRNVEAAEENRRVASDRYHEGVLPSSDLLDAETNVLRAGLDRAEALAQLRLAVAGLDRAVGR